MIRVVLDANQFVSALLKPASNSAEILSLIKKDRIKLVLSNAIISEITSVLLYPKIMKRHHKSPEFIAAFIKKLHSVAILTEGKLKVEVITDDPSDNKYLECAIEGKADFIVSGDHHLKEVKSFKGIRILDPAMFLTTIKGKFK